MTYDQSLSPRLGQKTPLETTYVRMFTGEEIPEAAWRGQLIYRIESQKLQIYDETAAGGAGGWLEIVGGTAGLVTFVGGESPPPTSVNAGDIWYDTDQGHMMFRAAAAGVNTIGTGAWESQQDGAIGQVQGQADGNTASIGDLQTVTETLNATVAQLQTDEQLMLNDTTFSDVDPSDADALNYNDGSVWFVRDTATNIITTVWELRDGHWTKLVLSLADTGDVVTDSGWYDVLYDEEGHFRANINTISWDRLSFYGAPIGETIAVGDLLSVTTDSFGSEVVKKACAASGSNYPAHGFSLEDVSSGSPTVYSVGPCPAFGSSSGPKWLSTTPGRFQDYPPSGAGELVQQVGWVEVNGDSLFFQPQTVVKVV